MSIAEHLLFWRRRVSGNSRWWRKLTGCASMLLRGQIAKFTSACWFDRAGLGWSDPSPIPQTSAAIADDLHALLRAAGVGPPYVLVGASFSGFNVRVFAGKYPTEVAGAVLVDSAHEDQNH